MIKIYNSVFTGILIVLSVVCFSQVSLPKLVSDGMVLQRNTDVKIWGWAAPNEKVRFIFWGKFTLPRQVKRENGR